MAPGDTKSTCLSFVGAPLANNRTTASAVSISLVAACLAALWGCGVSSLDFEELERPIDIATGTDGGVYHAVGEGLADQLASRLPKGRPSVATTAGSTENVRRLNDGLSDFAFVQSDSEGGPRVNTVAVLYEEVLQVVVRVRGNQKLRDIPALRGRRLYLGARGSGSVAVARDVLTFFELSEEDGDYEPLYFDPKELPERWSRGEVDAAFVISALPSPLVEGIIELGDASILPLGQLRAGGAAEGIGIVFPAYKPARIPVRTYGTEPEDPVATVAISAVLVAREGLAPETVRVVAQTLFEERLAIAASDEAAQVARLFREAYDASAAPYPYHEGARIYYDREEPPFLVAYAEAISLAITIGVGLFSGAIALREWLRRGRKNRIDDYYIRVQDHSRDIPDADLAQLDQIEEKLHGVRRDAFADLVAEKLEANESFIIFQDFLQAELGSIERRREAP